MEFSSDQFRVCTSGCKGAGGDTGFVWPLVLNVEVSESDGGSSSVCGCGSGEVVVEREEVVMVVAW